MTRKVREILQRFRQWLDIAGILLVIMSIFVIGSAVVYYVSGMGEPPHVEVSVTARDNSILLNVLDGVIPAEDWEYLVFDERVNPPMTWNPAPADMRPGENILLGSDLHPATYRVQMRYKPTLKFIFETKVTVGG